MYYIDNIIHIMVYGYVYILHGKGLATPTHRIPVLLSVCLSVLADSLPICSRYYISMGSKPHPTPMCLLLDVGGVEGVYTYLPVIAIS